MLKCGMIHYAFDPTRAKTTAPDMLVIDAMQPRALANFVLECAKVLADGAGVLRVYRAGDLVAEFDAGDVAEAMRRALDRMKE